MDISGVRLLKHVSVLTATWQNRETAVLKNGHAMKHSPVLCPALLSLILTTSIWGEKTAIETIGAFRGAGWTPELYENMESEGYRITGDNGDVLCEIWWREEVPSGEKSDILGAIYRQLSRSVLLGVISFPEGTRDFCGQPIRAGVYTLRYELLPNDGNHMGVAPLRDFLLLVPAEMDTAALATLTYEELVSLSKRASATNHPAVLSLYYPESENDSPAVFENDEGDLVFLDTLTTQGDEDLPIALVIVGEAELNH